MKSTTQPESQSFIERAEYFWEHRIVFGSRWLLAPAYCVLVFVLAVLAYKTVEEFIELLSSWHNADEARAIAQVLVIVDIVLVMNLVLMVLFVGYENFVSRIDFKRFEKSVDRPLWLGHLDYSGLKIQLIGSVIAISSILLLRLFVDMIDPNANPNTAKVILMIALHVTFVASALILAIVNKLVHATKGSEKIGSL